MCCINDPKLARNLYRRMKKGKTIFYKVYDIWKTNGIREIRSPCQKTIVKGPGIVDSILANDIEEINKQSRETKEEIHIGIHVCLTENETLTWTEYHPESVVIKVKAKAKDLIGCDEKSAVFTKIEIPEGEWEKMMKKKIVKT